MIFINRNIHKMRIRVNETQYNKILIKEKETTSTLEKWVEYMGDVLSLHIHKFNVKEDVNTHTNLFNKLRGKNFLDDLPIDNFIITLIENRDKEEININFNPYWSLLVEGNKKPYLKDIELDIELPSRKVNGINEIEEIKRKLYTEFIKIKSWYRNQMILMEQDFLEYTWEGDPTALVQHHLLDDAAALNQFFNKVVNKNINITGGKEGVLTIDDTFSLAEKILLNNASIASSSPVYLGFKENEIEASYDIEEIKDDFSLRKTKFWEDLKNKGIPFRVFDNFVGTADLEQYGELPLFPTQQDIPEESHQFLPTVSLDGKDYSIAFVKHISEDALNAYGGDKEKLIDKGYTIYRYDPEWSTGVWETLETVLPSVSIEPNEEGYVQMDDPLLYTPISTGNYFGKGNNKLYGKKGHSGHDYVAVNKKLVWLKSGKVTSAHFGGKKDRCGGTITVKTEDGRKMIFCHMSEIFVDKGEKINPGRILGVTGGSKGQKGAGHSTGAHLHTGMKVGRKFTDPHDYVGKDYKLLRDE